MRWGRIEIFNCWIIDLKFDPKRHLWNITGKSRRSYSCFCCTSSRTARIPCDVHKNEVNVLYTLLKKKIRNWHWSKINNSWFNILRLVQSSYTRPFVSSNPLSKKFRTVPEYKHNHRFGPFKHKNTLKEHHTNYCDC